MSLNNSMRALHLSLLALAVTANAQALKPSGSYFQAQHGLPAFSLRLGNDTASVCNSSTPGISGFVDSSDDGMASQMFFWLFESKNDASSDPFILWMTGGPGASSTGAGNLMELGPCRIAPEGGYTVDNPYSWNTNASLLFVDQPVSVGFSIGDKIPEGLTEASEVMDRFLRQFLVAFPQLSHRDFYIAGESYGGSWVPALAHTILNNQGSGESLSPFAPAFGLSRQDSQGPLRKYDESFGSSLPHVNLKGIMIGNGLIRLPKQNPGIFEALCSGPESLFTASQCLEWAPEALWCENNLGICETAGWLSDECHSAHQRCTAMSQVVTDEMGRNPYDWRRTCGDNELCYDELLLIDDFMNRTDVKAALGVDAETPWRGVSFDVLNQWERIGDLWKASDTYVNSLLDAVSEQGIRVLIYVGDKDLYCNAAGMRRLVNEGLSWHGHPFFRFRELVPWYHEAKQSGRWKAYNELTYAEIFDSGHLAPFDLPAELSTLINSWMLQGHLPAQ